MWTGLTPFPFYSCAARHNSFLAKTNKVRAACVARLQQCLNHAPIRSAGQCPGSRPQGERERAGTHVTTNPTASMRSALRVCIGDAMTATCRTPRDNSNFDDATGRPGDEE